ncbi:major facilitator superfamily domain-containing protein [Aspergillus alliaceus]|uniref:major facilitator superfamily domain-containing protein n=1 Tax=Petromyces alliaceus TaxID=209559 RepID=UPI0012A46909|nr:major facilitator superfamily domain-containing protein [Aspergillus alliaceus]KAB8234273.1 major facilitator superfamily domain-containing protein [Aspergillus alliaceus]
MADDLEKQGHDGIDRQVARSGLRRRDSKIIEWDTEHELFPRNWPVQHKLYSMMVPFFLEFYTTVISTTGASAAEETMQEYGLSRVVALTGFQFMYGMGQALGGLIMPPFSETHGRRVGYLLSAIVYSISSLLVGVVPSPVGMFVGRFLSGYASAVPSIVLAGSIEDLYTHRTRLWLIWLWNCSTTIGLCVGPIYGSYIVSSIGWRWIYYISAMATAVVFSLLFGVRETRPTTLLSQKFDRLKTEVGDLDLEIRNPDGVNSKRELLQVILLRPARVGFTEPIIILVAVMNASAWGMLYLFTESFTVVFSQFGWSQRATSLPFLALLPGVLLSGCIRFWDHYVIKQQQQKTSKPEDKIGGFAIAAPALAMGLWIFGWTVPPLVHTHWVVPMFGLVLIGFAANEFAYTLSGYIADSYTIYASSGLAVVACLRAIASGCMPLFAYQMYSGLGSNIATSIIAVIATVYCGTPFVFLKYGQRLREHSQFARFSAEVNGQQMAD